MNRVTNWHIHPLLDWPLEEDVLLNTQLCCLPNWHTKKVKGHQFEDFPMSSPLQGPVERLRSSYSPGVGAWIIWNHIFGKHCDKLKSSKRDLTSSYSIQMNWFFTSITRTLHSKSKKKLGGYRFQIYDYNACGLLPSAGSQVVPP